MTHQEFAKALAKHGLHLCSMPWGNRKGTYNLNPHIHSNIEKWADKNSGTMGMIDHGPKNNFIGTFAPQTMYLIMKRHPDISHQHYPIHYAFETKLSDHYNIIINKYLSWNIAQIDPEHMGRWQRDRHYRPDDKNLWALIRDFVYTPIIERDADDYVLIKAEDTKAKNSHNNITTYTKRNTATSYEFLDLQYFNDRKRFGQLYDTNDYEGDLSSTSFYTHLPLKLIKQWTKKNPLESQKSDMKPIRKIISVKKLIPIVQQAKWKQIIFHCTKPMYVCSPYQAMKRSIMSTRRGVMLNTYLLNLSCKRMMYRTFKQGLSDLIHSSKYLKHGPNVTVNKVLSTMLSKDSQYLELTLMQLYDLYDELDSLTDDICNSDHTLPKLDRTQSLGEAWALNEFRFAIKRYFDTHSYRFL